MKLSAKCANELSARPGLELGRELGSELPREFDNDPFHASCSIMAFVGDM